MCAGAREHAIGSPRHRLTASTPAATCCAQITDDAQGEVKALKVGQYIQPYAVRRHLVEAWCDAQTADSIAHFVAAHGLDNVAGGAPPVDDAAAAAATAAAAARHPYRGRYTVHELHDVFGDSVRDPTYSAIVCSEETRAGCNLINVKRAALGWPPLDIIVASIVRDAAGGKLSSTAIRQALHVGPPSPRGDDGGASCAAPPTAVNDHR